MNEVTKARIERMQNLLNENLNPSQLEIIDDSQEHLGHAPQQQGAGYFTVIIKSEKFNGISAVKRHQLVYQALQDMMDSEIHALQIKASA